MRPCCSCAARSLARRRRRKANRPSSREVDMKRFILAAAMAASIATPAVAQVANAELARLFADERAFVYREDPLSATQAGVHDYDDRLPSVTPEAQLRQTRENQTFLTRLQAIDRAQL